MTRGVAPRVGWTAGVGAAVAIAGLVVAAARSAGYLGGLKTAPAVVVSAAPSVVVADTVRPRQTMSQLFERHGVLGVDFRALARLAGRLDPRRLRVGQIFEFRHRKGETEPRVVVSRVAFDSRLWVRRGSDGWVSELEHIPYRTEPISFRGTIGASLYGSLDEAIPDEVLPQAERDRLAWDLASVYDWEVDFSRDLRAGDRFQVLIERLVSVEGEGRFGRILAARLDLSRRDAAEDGRAGRGSRVGGRARPLYAFLFDDGGRNEFYDERGFSMRRQFLAAPLEYRRISSRFSVWRLHPILGFGRAHLGTDYAAAFGTPVRVVGDGIVVFAGREGGYGNMIEIRHNQRFTTVYAHLAGLTSTMLVGRRVSQGDLVGFVGASGLATGTHLHYEFRVNGRPTDPRRVDQGSGDPVPAERREAFERERQRLLALMEDQPLAGARRGT